VIGQPGPWTTPADRAELDAACWALTDLIWTHRASCCDCASPPATCPPVRGAIETAERWWTFRQLQSRAEYLRRAA
jgi:hypothetical protein